MCPVTSIAEPGSLVLEGRDQHTSRPLVSNSAADLLIAIWFRWSRWTSGLNQRSSSIHNLSSNHKSYFNLYSSICTRINCSVVHAYPTYTLSICLFATTPPHLRFKQTANITQPIVLRTLPNSDVFTDSHHILSFDALFFLWKRLSVVSYNL